MKSWLCASSDILFSSENTFTFFQMRVKKLNITFMIHNLVKKIILNKKLLNTEKVFLGLN